MKRFVVSDLHGCFDLWEKCLDKIKELEPSGEKEIYVLGDVLDKGDRPIDLLLNIMENPFVYMINGNHELDFLDIHNIIHKYDPTVEECIKYDVYISNGGNPTIKQFCENDDETQQKILSFLEGKRKKLFFEIEENGESFVLTHGGISNFSSEKPLDEYTVEELTIHRYKYGEKFFTNKTLICGHTPTIKDNSSPAEIFVSDDGNFYNIDCGCVFRSYGGRLAILELSAKEPMDVHYIS